MSCTGPLSKGCCKGAVATGCSANPDNWQDKGQYEEVGGIKSYVTGDRNSDKVIVFIYDIFGFLPQTTRGADVLAEKLGAFVVMPDIFNPAFPIAKFPAQTQEAKDELGNFFKAQAELGASQDKVLTVTRAILEGRKASGATAEPKLGCFGLCWGGKVAMTTGNLEKLPFVATGQAHPTALTVEDTEKLTVPHLILPTKDEDPRDIQAFRDVKKPEGSDVREYPKMIHGFMGGRAILDEPENMEAFNDGYKFVADWFNQQFSK